MKMEENNKSKEKETEIAYQFNITYVNGDQYNYPTATHVTINNYHGAEGEKLVVNPDDKLSSYIPQQDLCIAVTKIASMCEKSQDIITKLVPVLRNECHLDVATICSKRFLEALVPHLTSLSNPNYENLKKVVNAERIR